MKTKGKGGKGPNKRQAVLNFEQGSIRLQVKMPFNKSSNSHDSEKLVAGPSTKKLRTTKNSNKDKDIEGERLGSKSSKREKKSKMLSQKKRLLSVKASDSTERKKRDSRHKKRDASEKITHSSEKKKRTPVKRRKSRK